MEIMRAPSADKGSVLAKLGTLTVAPRFTQEMFPALWDAALRYGIDPVGLVAQSYKETGKGNFGGQVKPQFYNTAGIKIRHVNRLFDFRRAPSGSSLRIGGCCRVQCNRTRRR